MTTEKTPSKLTKDTFVHLSLVLLLLGAVWGFATDRQQALGQLMDHEKRITAMEWKIDKVVDGVQRIEVRLGTYPAAKSSPDSRKE